MKNKKVALGFTLIELLVVIAIIGILSSVVLAALNTAREKARVAKAQTEVKNLRVVIELLADDTGQWPGHRPVGEVLSGTPGNEVYDLNLPIAGLVATDGNFPNWQGPYISSVPADPWGNNYFFDTDYDIDPGAGRDWVAAMGSFGSNGIGPEIYDNDNVIHILVR